MSDRFWAKVATSPGDECWEWKGAVGRHGYGNFAVDGRRSSPLYARAHRFAYELCVGPVPDGLIVCHRCDNRRCVNPDHLFVGTYADNTADMMTKGRHVAPARLTATEVADLRKTRRAGASLSEIARQFDISKSHACDIVNGRYWRQEVTA